MSDYSAQRRSPRYRIQLPLFHKAGTSASSSVGMGRTRNLSEGGACLESAEPLPPSTPLTLVLQTDQGGIRMEGKVVWTGQPGSESGGILHGLAFTQVGAEQHTALCDLLLSKGEMRQAGVRLPLDISVTCQPKGQSGPPLQGRTGDLSRGGLSLRLPQPLPPGTTLEITLHTPSGPLTAEGEVVWVTPPEGQTPSQSVPHGLRFKALSWSTSLSLGLVLSESA